MVGGDAVEVGTLVPFDADAHQFSPTPQHAQLLSRADLVVFNGLGFEGWLQRLVRASGYKGPLLQLSEGIVPLRLGGLPDPHAWQDLGHAQHYVARLRDAFSAARPAHAPAFAERATAYNSRLQALLQSVRSQLATVPPARRRVVSPHDAFGYLGAAFDIQFLPVRGRASGSEASAADVARLIDALRKQRANAVFVENISDPRLLQRIAQEAGVAVGGRLYSDALSAPGTEADTFLKMYMHNTQALIQALVKSPAPPPLTKP